MMIPKQLLIPACLFAIGTMFPALEVPAQSPPSSVQNEHAGSLQMTVDYGQGKTKRRHSRLGLMEPVGLPLNRATAITLKFPGHRAGESIRIGAPDGGEISGLAGNQSLSANGSIVFNFAVSGTPGLYRLLVELSSESHVLSFYAFAPPVAP